MGWIQFKIQNYKRPRIRMSSLDVSGQVSLGSESFATDFASET